MINIKNIRIITLILIIAIFMTLTTGIVLAAVPANITKSAVINQEVAFTKADFTGTIQDFNIVSIDLSNLPNVEEAGSFFVSETQITSDTTITIEQADTLKFKPAEGFTGTATATFSLKNATEASDNANIVITYTETPSASPVASEEPSASPVASEEPSASPVTSELPSSSPVVSEEPSPSPTPSIESSAAPLPNIYEDVTNHWAKYSINKLYEENVWKGEEFGNKKLFYPEVRMTRMDFWLASLSALGYDYNDIENPSAISFADEANYPAYVVKLAKKAYEVGLIKGSLEGGAVYIKPYDPLIRVEAIQMINNLVKGEGDPNTAPGFVDDNEIPSWAFAAINHMKDYKIINGYTDGTFRPNVVIVRAEGAEILVQIRKLLVNKPQTLELLLKTLLK